MACIHGYLASLIIQIIRIGGLGKGYDSIMKTYNTSQRQHLVDFMKNNADRQYTIEEIAEHIENVGKSTVYRLINRMVDEGIVRRTIRGNSRQFLYQYSAAEGCSSHLHMKCRECGKVLHMDDGQSKILMEILHESRNFDLDLKETLLMGRCEKCSLPEEDY